MSTQRSQKSLLVILGILAICIVTVAGIYIAMRGGESASVSTEPSLDDWFAAHPTVRLQYELGSVVDLLIPQGQSVTIQFPENALGIGEVLIGTDGTNDYFEILKLPEQGSSQSDHEFVAGHHGGQLFGTGQMWGVGPPPCPLWAMTAPRVAPGSVPLGTVQIRFAMDSEDGQATQTANELQRQLRLGEITDLQHIQAIDTLITDKWPGLGWTPLQ